MTGDSPHEKAYQELQKIFIFPCGREGREVKFAVKSDKLTMK